MKDRKHFILIGYLLIFSVSIYQNVNAQENLAQEAYAIFEQNCLNCHGEHGAFTEEIIIEHTVLLETGAVIPGQPIDSTLYTRLLEKDPIRRMPLGQPPLPPAAIHTIRNWIQAGAPSWEHTTEIAGTFITPAEMLTHIENHVNTLAPFDRTFARYFTFTHLYNADESAESLHAYQRALSKLVNSLSWGREVIRPQPIDGEETIFYIDLRDYEWEIGPNRWTLIEVEYPYSIAFDAPTETTLREKLTTLRQEMNCEVPFVHVDWFLATASLPPLYHDILGLPETVGELEADLDVNVVENIRNAAGRRVWRAGFNNSGVSNHNRVVERHISRYGAYWKSYDFAGSVGSQNIFTHPLSFTHDGGEIIFNLPNGLQAYYLTDAGGRRLDAAPISIVSNPAASDPTVRNGLSCIGCHTEGMKAFEDQVRVVVQQNPNPPYNKAQALRLYTEKVVMDPLVSEDTQRYRQALEAAGDIFGGIEPVQRFHEAYRSPLDASYAAAAVGLETETFLAEIRENVGLQSLGLLVLENGTIKRDTWTENFSEVVFALDFPSRSAGINVDPQTEIIPGASVHIPDPNLRAAIADTLDKAPGDPITTEEMATLQKLYTGYYNISDLTGLEFAKNLIDLTLQDNPLSDISPLASLTKLRHLSIRDTEVFDLSPLSRLYELEVIDATSLRISSLAPLAGLKNLKKLDTAHTDITDLSPLAGLTNLTRLRLYDCKATDLSPLKGLTKLRWFGLPQNDNVQDFSPLSGLTELRHLDLFDTGISDLSPLSGLVNLETLILNSNNIVDVSPLTSLRNLKRLELHENNISDFSPLDPIRETIEVFIWDSNPGFPQGGPKIAGPWLWLTLPANWGEDFLLTDYFAKVSNNKVTEEQIATHGVSEGASIGESVWSVGTLEPYNADRKYKNATNLTRLFDAQGAIEVGDGADHVVVYGSIPVFSPRTQQTKIFIGTSHPRKVYLNGKLVHDQAFGLGDHDYKTFFPITLQPGKNVFLIKLGAKWETHLYSFLFGFEPGTEYEVYNPRVGYTFSEPKVHVGDTFTLDLSTEDVYDLAGWQFDIAFDPTILEAVEVNEGDFLKEGGGTTFFQKETIDNATGKITKLSSARLSEDGVTGTGTLLSVTFTAKTPGQTQLTLENFQLAAITGEPIPVGLPEILITIEVQLTTGDVNRDGQVSILDMVLVARQFGNTVPSDSAVDINGDGVINVLDLILVSQHMGESSDAAAPSLVGINESELDPATVRAWIAHAELEDDGSIAFQQGIAKLRELLSSLLPKETALLPNYPNPFNPETWIPYQLSEPAEVTLRIYAVNGELVRTLALGHIPAGIYQSRSRAAYWDGKNEVGESVASGVYFYTLSTESTRDSVTAGNFTATRKMLIRK
ncbi:MAG: cohesin domain-containing protein [Candidatus Poribacteria bacterium]|nr:cohesin domain-containing protein [Candidatus Poribacteria bacterium]